MHMSSNIDITSKIMTIERLKASLFLDMASLNMALVSDKDDDISEKLCDIILNSYLLSEKLGFDFNELNKIINDKIRLNILEEGNISSNDYIKLLKNFKKNLEGGNQVE